MAMSMQELFYGEREPVHFVHYGRHHSYAAVPELRTFDLMVPMCCARCEDQVRDALFALRTVGNVDCDAPNQRVTVTGCLEPAHALKQVRRVKNGATLWSSSYSAQRYMQQGRSRSSYVQIGTAVVTGPRAVQQAIQQRRLHAELVSGVHRLHADALHQRESEDCNSRGDGMLS